MQGLATIRRAAGAAASAAVAVVLVLGAAGCSSGPDLDTPDSVKDSYTQFAGAVGSKNGPAAADLVTASTLDFYGTLRDLALDADEKTLRDRLMIEQLNVLSMRNALPAETLRSASTHDLVAEAVKTGVITTGSLPQTGLEKIAIDGDTATAVLGLGAVEEGAGQELPLRFARQDDAWKIDLAFLTQSGEKEMTRVEEQNKISAEEVVDAVALSRYGKEKAGTLWTPVGRG